MSDNGERLIERPPGQKVLAQIIVTLVETGPGQTATNFTHTCPGELACRGLYDKGRAVMDQFWAQQNAPRVLPAQALPRFKP